jgi:signal transduction histidine kinase
VVYRLRHRAGHYIWAEAAFQRVEDGADIRIITAIRDVTERQRQAARLERAKAEAEAGARIKAEFLANMSHELRTPLTGMLGVHDLLQSDPTLGAAQRRYVRLAQEAGRSLLTIVNDILDLSKIEAGEMAIEHVPFVLRDLLENCRQIAAEAAPAGVTLALQTDEDVPHAVHGDPTRVRQVLLNLVTNAVKFTPQGRVTVQVSWPAQNLRVAVTDTGIGIAPEEITMLRAAARRAITAAAASHFAKAA